MLTFICLFYFHRKTQYSHITHKEVNIFNLFVLLYIVGMHIGHVASFFVCFLTLQIHTNFKFK